MADTIWSIAAKNSYLDGSYTFGWIARKNKKDSNLVGSDHNDSVTLDSLARSGSSVKKNSNLHYYGNEGIDTLRYRGDNNYSTDLKVLDGNTVIVEGGHSKDSSHINFSSLDVTAHNVEIFDFNYTDDTADFYGLSYGVTAYGGDGNDSLKGTMHADKLYGGDGNDTLVGNGGDDYIDGGDDADTIEGGAGADLIFGGKGNDIIWGGTSGITADSANEMYGGDGNDTIHGAIYVQTTPNVDIIADNIDIAYGGAGDDIINGYDGNDILDGGTGADKIYGGEGNDIISSGSLKDQAVSDQLWGGSGADMFIIGDGSTDYTSDFVLDISAAFPNKGSDWTSILDAAGSAVGIIPGVKAIGSVAKTIASGFDAYYTATNSSKTTFTIDADWGETAEAQVRDFNPFEDHIMIPIAASETDLNTHYTFEWETANDLAFTLRDNRGTADREILAVQWADDLVDYFPDYMTENGKGVTINSDFFDALKASLKESYVNYDGSKLYFGDELQDLGEWVGEMAGSNLGFMDVGAYAGWTIYDNEAPNDMWIGTNLNDILGAFVPAEANTTAPREGYYSDTAYLYGMGGDDLLFGGAGDDVINGGENLDGTADSDTIAFFGADSVDIDLGTKIWKENLGIYYSVSSAIYSIKTDNEGGRITKVDSDKLYFIENVIGSDGNDIIKGDEERNILSGAGGDDELTGGGGADTFVFAANSGKDTITDLDKADVLVFEGLSASERDALINSLSDEGNSLSIDSDNSVTWETSLHKSSFQTSISTNEGDTATYDVTVAAAQAAERAYHAGLTNLTDALNASAADQSTNYVSDDYLAFNVLDGDVDTINHTGKSDPAPWLSIDLGEDALIEFIDLENRQDNWTSSRLTGAHIEVLDDGAVVWSSSDLTSAHNQLIEVGGIVGDEVRIDHAGGHYLHIAEIDIYGDFIA
ncbi:RTX-I toxin determinant A from serotypes 1/9 [Pseudovibrio sp. Ad46]|uniref:discoidin domain-containing protein n=1 Tax=unclassified Pseudovibrio TaxID=2627060 RepID=UPI0007AE7CE2|nr:MULTISPECIES: discoidin domain-containing protein [unclassified Pseudovibrio]KZK83288.1 RTX-I toxin determinant A from serotypes 1/9 [Pseudovibrio sp. Ad46]KZK95162.1 RTX-I toxin determinant A from serotypes 1/9 [Pseudovibrio sp. Ad5]